MTGLPAAPTRTDRALVTALVDEIDQLQAENRADRGQFGDEEYVGRLRSRAARIAQLEQRIDEEISPATEVHQWTYGRGKLGVGKAQITASRNNTGWRYPANHAPGWRPCGGIVTATGCPERAMWQVKRWKQNATYVGYYCDRCLDDEETPVVFGGDGNCTCTICEENL